MSFDVDALYALLPEIHRIRDAEQGEPLKALLTVIAGQAVILEENLAQLYDDQFVETAAGWVLPYLGDLLGITGLPRGGPERFTPRAEVANTLGYRRRKGTAAMLEQLAHDTTGLPARAVEFFQILATTQYLNHLRPENLSFLSVRDADRLESLGTAFEHLRGSADLSHTVDVRRMAVRDGVPRILPLPAGMAEDPARDDHRIAGGRGRYNIPTIGVFLYRLRAQPRTSSPSVRLDDQRFLLSPLGVDTQVFHTPRTEDDLTHLAEPVNVPGRISRRVLARALAAESSLRDAYYGDRGSLLIQRISSTFVGDPVLIPADQVEVCDLTGWVRKPQREVGIDPVLGRIALRAPAPNTTLLVSFHEGFSADLGGGEYERSASFDARVEERVTVRKRGGDGAFTTIQSALTALAGKGTEGVVEILDSGRYEEALSIPATLEKLTIRAADRRRPILVLTSDLLVPGGAVESQLTLNGLLISGGAVRLVTAGKLGRIRIKHCTLVPGLALAEGGAPQNPSSPSLVVSAESGGVEIERSIVGALQVSRDVTVTIVDSIIDANGEATMAYAGVLPGEPGGTLRIENSTVIGRVWASAIELASNTLFVAAPSPGAERPLPVEVERRQEGCMRFSYIPEGSRVPTRYRCQPAIEQGSVGVRVGLCSTRYGDPEYGRLALSCPVEIRQGADDESEMGAFHLLYQPQREAHLRARLDEYLRFGLEAGIVYAT